MKKTIDILQNSLESATLVPNKAGLKPSFPSFAKTIIISLALLSTLGLAQDHALIIGCCSEYENPNSGIPTLRGTANDAKSMLDTLLKRGLKRANIDYLTERKATHKNIVSKLQAMTSSDLKAGDKLYLYYSGHGTSVGDRSDFGKKITSNKEILKRLNNSAGFIPYDFDLKNIEKTMIITSRDFKPTFKKLDGKGVQIVWIADACYAGNGYRSGANSHIKGTNLNSKAKERVKKESQKYSSRGIRYNHLIFFGATVTNMVTQEVDYLGKTRGAFSVEVEKCINKRYGTKNITNKNLKECLKKHFAPFAFSSAIYPIDKRLDKQIIIKAPRKSHNQSKPQKSFRDKLFALQSNKPALEMNIYSTYKPSLAINKFCNGEELAIDLKSKKPYVMAFTKDRNGRVIMLKPDGDSKFNQKDIQIVKTVVQPPFGKDQVKVFTTNDANLYKKIYTYRSKKEGILSGGDIESIYKALAKSRNFQTAKVELESLSTNFKTCRRGD